MPSGVVALISRETALSEGRKRYFTGKPCKHGHIVSRLVDNGTCVTCHNLLAQRRKQSPTAHAYSSGWYARNLDKARAYYREKAQQPESRFRLYQRDARRANRVWELSFKQFVALIGQPCHYCGHEGFIGLDRIDNALGYSVSNVTPCCATCNRGKRTMSYNEFLAYLKQVVSHWLKKN